MDYDLEQNVITKSALVYLLYARLKRNLVLLNAVPALPGK